MNSTEQVLNEEIDVDWWRSAVVYQIYPRSFQDSNSDGVGDLKGITTRLDYVSELGVDAIWISPFFCSPMKDFGYDVSDYRDIDPLFGTLADFDELIRKANALNIRILVDLVVSHTSDQHEWFIESRKDHNNKKADWYVWADAKPDGTAPNNWLSIFGGSAWQWDSRRCQYYLHNFLESQPDLNFHNNEVQNAVLDIARFWLERGVSGFRLDTINFYFCDQQLRDNPPLPAVMQNSSIAPKVNPYNYQDHQFDKNRPENLAFLKRLRTLMNQYPGSTAIGEVGDAQLGMELMSQYTTGEDLMHTCYAFDFLSEDALTPQRIVEVLEALDQVDGDAWPCWAFSNHDVTRHASRWQLGSDQLRLMIAVLVSLRGTVCLYQGEELGLPEAEIEYEDLRDPYGIEFWPEFKGRDGCRTPMVWSQEETNAGFSSAKPWLPQPKTHRHLAAQRQRNDPDSLFSFYRKMIQLRKSLPALGLGSMEGVGYTDELLHFGRQFRQQQVYCAFNFGAQAVTVNLPVGRWCFVDADIEEFSDTDQTRFTLAAGKYSLLRRLG